MRLGRFPNLEPPSIALRKVLDKRFLKENEMRKLRLLFFSLVGVLMAAAPALAQATQAAADNESSVNKYRAIAIGFGFAIAAGLGALGQGRVAAAAAEGAARNPGAAGRIQTMMILGLALIESLVLFALLVVFARV
jgi:F-type H+-transporting ATPase subunit c